MNMRTGLVLLATAALTLGHPSVGAADGSGNLAKREASEGAHRDPALHIRIPTYPGDANSVPFEVSWAQGRMILEKDEGLELLVRREGGDWERVMTLRAIADRRIIAGLASRLKLPGAGSYEVAAIAEKSMSSSDPIPMVSAVETIHINEQPKKNYTRYFSDIKMATQPTELGEKVKLLSFKPARSIRWSVDGTVIGEVKVYNTVARPFYWGGESRARGVQQVRMEFDDGTVQEASESSK